MGNALEPVLGVAGDTPRRSTLVRAGGLAFVLATALTAAATGFWPLLGALLIGYPASSAFVSLSQASLMDREPERREPNMAAWALAGSVGIVAGPLFLAAAVATGLGWRGAMALLAAAALPLALAAPRLVAPDGRSAPGLAAALRGALLALREREVLRWLAVLAASDLLLDVFHAFLALYFVDVLDVSPAQAGLAVAVWTGAGLVGDALLLGILRRTPGPRVLRASALAVLAVFPAFLVVPGVGPKLGLLALLGVLNAGWYAIPKARLYAALPGRSGTAVAIGSVNGLAQASFPLGIGLLAGALGLATALWALVLAPLALLALVPRRS